jgi:hypothetical protein
MLTGLPYKLLPATFPGATAIGVKISEAHAFLLTHFCPASYASTAEYQKELKRRGILRADFDIALHRTMIVCCKNFLWPADGL